MDDRAAADPIVVVSPPLRRRGGLGLRVPGDIIVAAAAAGVRGGGEEDPAPVVVVFVFLPPSSTAFALRRTGGNLLFVVVLVFFLFFFFGKGGGGGGGGRRSCRLDERDERVGARLLQPSGARRGREEEIVGGARNGFVGDDEGVSIAAVEQVSFLPSFLPSFLHSPRPSVRPSVLLDVLSPSGRDGGSIFAFFRVGVVISSSPLPVRENRRGGIGGIGGIGGGMTPSPLCACVLRILYHRVFVR